MVTSTHTYIVRKEIYEYQHRLHGELTKLHPDATCVYLSGTQGTEWWKNKSLYDPDDLRNCPYEIPHHVFLSDRVVAFVLLHPERWTISKRHEYWPGDFAANGMPVSGRVLTGRPAITTTGALVEIRGYGILCGETEIARGKVVRTAYIWKPSEIKKDKKVQPVLIPDVFCGLRSRDVAPAVLEVLFRSLVRYHDELELTKNDITEPPALEVEIASLKARLATLQRREARREEALEFVGSSPLLLCWICDCEKWVLTAG